MSERYKCTLSPEVLRKAVSELNEPEDNDARLAAIDKLKNRFDKNTENLKLIRSDDAFILRFLRVRKFNEDRANDSLMNYHRLRQEWRELYDLMETPDEISRLLSVGPLIPLQHNRAKDGTFVIIGRPGYGFGNEKNALLKFFVILLLSLEKLLENEEFQIYGVTAIHDLSKVTFSIAMQMASQGRKFMRAVQEAMPIRVKSVNLVNEPMVMDMAFAVASRFMKEKMKRRFQLHGSSFENLHEKVAKEHLPSFLGGSGPDLNADWWKNEMIDTNVQSSDSV